MLSAGLSLSKVVPRGGVAQEALITRFRGVGGWGILFGPQNP